MMLANLEPVEMAMVIVSVAQAPRDNGYRRRSTKGVIKSAG